MSLPAVAKLPQKIYVLVSKDKETARYNDQMAYFKTIPALEPLVEYIEPCWVGRDEDGVDFSRYSATLKKREIMPTESHVKCLRAALDAGHEHFMVCESDSLLPPNFPELLNHIYADWENLGTIGAGKKSMIYLGNGNGMMPRQTNRRSALLYEENGTRCVDCMLMTRDAAQALYDATTSENIRGPVDHYWNDVIRSRGITAYWLHPYEVQQGSSVGKYRSHLLS
jgi:GR25 family glycosyltransferase involved in LPS biosynthesis